LGKEKKMEINYVVISAWAAVIATLSAVIAIWVEARRARINRGIDTLMKYSEEFSSEEFLKRRLRFARILKKKLCRKLSNKEDMELSACATFFLDHYEIIGFLLRRKILDKELVYIYYSYSLFGFWPFLKEVIDIYVPDDPTLWENAIWLYSDLTKLYKKRVPNGKVEFTDEKIMRFIETEIS
jgi:hypothetical protein